MTTEKPWISYEKAAELAEVKVTTVRNWAWQGNIRTRPRGNARVYRLSLERFLETDLPQGDPDRIRNIRYHGRARA